MTSTTLKLTLAAGIVAAGLGSVPAAAEGQGPTAKEWLVACKASEANRAACTFYAVGVRDMIDIANARYGTGIACIPSHLSGNAVYQTAISAMRKIVPEMPDANGRAVMIGAIVSSYPCHGA